MSLFCDFLEHGELRVFLLEMLGAQECSLEGVIPASFVSAHLQSGFPIWHQVWPSEDYSIMDKTPTHALFTQHYISLAC